MIWRSVIALTHLSVWSAPANGGKTALAMFAAGELAANGMDVLFFQEDASSGDLPALHKHAIKHGYRLLNSTLTGSSPEAQLSVLRTLAKEGADLCNSVMFFDTLKKYADLMNKGNARQYFKLMRSLTQRGATVVLLGHTNKYKDRDDKPIFEGVGDVRNDVDELFYIDSTEKDALGKVTLTIRPDKVRCFAREATFMLDTLTMQVHPADEVVDVGAIRENQRRIEDDTPLIDCISDALAPGDMNRTALINLVAKNAGVSVGRVRAVLVRYLSADPQDGHALWHERKTGQNNACSLSLKPKQLQ